MAGIRKKKEEQLSETNINKVIDLLSADKPITKKEACGILNIAYNTTRLSKNIADHNETIQFRAIRKAQNKGKGVTELEKKAIKEMFRRKELRGRKKKLRKKNTILLRGSKKSG